MAGSLLVVAGLGLTLGWGQKHCDSGCCDKTAALLPLQTVCQLPNVENGDQFYTKFASSFLFQYEMLSQPHFIFGIIKLTIGILAFNHCGSVFTSTWKVERGPAVKHLCPQRKMYHTGPYCPYNIHESNLTNQLLNLIVKKKLEHCFSSITQSLLQ